MKSHQIEACLCDSCQLPRLISGLPATCLWTLIHNRYFNRRPLDVTLGPIHHLHGDFRYAKANFGGDPHGAVEGVASATLLEQVLAA
jgi:hypothetical protein